MWAAIISAAISAISAIAAARAKGKETEAGLNAAQSQSTNQGNAQQFEQMLSSLMADLQQRGFQREEYQTNTQNALRGGLLQGVQDVNLTPPPGINMGQISGGLRPSSIVGRESIGRNLQRDALLGLTAAGNTGPRAAIQRQRLGGTGSDKWKQGGFQPTGRMETIQPAPGGIAGLSTFPPLPTVPDVSTWQAPRSSRMDQVLGNVGQYGSILASVLAAYQANKQAGGAGAGAAPAGSANYMGGATFGVPAANPNPYNLRMR